MILLTVIANNSAETTILTESPKTLILDGVKYWLIPTETQQPAILPKPNLTWVSPITTPIKRKPRGKSDQFNNFLTALEETLINGEGNVVDFRTLQDIGRKFYPSSAPPVGPALEQLKRRKLAEKTPDGWRAL